jgi:hypothetical protein
LSDMPTWDHGLSDKFHDKLRMYLI